MAPNLAIESRSSKESTTRTLRLRLSTSSFSRDFKTPDVAENPARLSRVKLERLSSKTKASTIERDADSLRSLGRASDFSVTCSEVTV